MKHPASLPILILALNFGPGVLSAQTTYVVEPVALSDGYEIVGGYITTTGLMGNLSVSEITDYEIRVSGPVPYVFSPTNPFAEVILEGAVQATPTEIFLPIDTDPLDQMANRFQLRARDNTAANCSNCSQILNYQQLFVPGFDETRRNYGNTDMDDPDPLAVGFLFTRPQSVLVIARVPEPGPLMLISVGLSLMAVWRLRC